MAAATGGTGRGTTQHDIDVSIAPGFDDRAPRELFESAVRATLMSRRLRVPRAVSVTLTDSRTLRRLNKRHLGDDMATDVLSFNTDFPGLRRPDGVQELGAIVIAAPVAARGARARGVSMEEELALLTVHGTLHLLGFDHEHRAEDVRMRRLERAALRRMGREGAARQAAPDRMRHN